MGFFDLFKKKDGSRRVSGKDYDVVVSDDGQVSGSYRVRLNGSDLDVPFQTSMDELDEEERRRSDPSSCSRPPKTDEVVLPVVMGTGDRSFLLDAVGWEKGEFYFHAMTDAFLAGYNNFVMPMADYEEALSFIAEKQKEAGLSGELQSYQNAGMDAEKAGELDAAVYWFERCIAFGESSPSLRISAYLHSVERLTVVYRKLKRYEDEVRVIRLGLSHRNDERVYDAPFARLETRLGRALELLEKSKS